MSQLVSVVIPAFNAAGFITDAIESVLRQTYQPVECIVVNDGSTDQTKAVVASFDGKITVLDQPNQGVAIARNKGVAAAKGDYVAFLDADDVWLETKLELQLDKMSSDAGIEMTYTGITVATERLQAIRDLPAPDPQSALENILLMREPTPSVAQTGVFLKDALLSLGGFDERMSTSADADLACRALLSLHTLALQDCLVLYRTHSGQMHADLRATQGDMLLLYEKLFHQHPELRRKYAKRARAELFTTLALAGWRNSSRAGAIRHLSQALRNHPPAVLRNLARAAFRRFPNPEVSPGSLSRSWLSGRSRPPSRRDRSAD